MPKAKEKGGSILGAVGGVLIGAAIVFFVGTIVLNNLKTINVYGDVTSGATKSATQNATIATNRANWASSNTTINQIITFLSVATILLAVLGIVMVGAMIIRYISGSFGG
jgi:hypothetical protein